MPPVARRPIATSLLVLLLVPAAATARTPRFSGVALGKGPSGSVGRRFAVAPQATGRYRYVWSVAGRRVASWSVRIGPGD
jgi:hypothetical protein